MIYVQPYQKMGFLDRFCIMFFHAKHSNKHHGLINNNKNPILPSDAEKNGQPRVTLCLSRFHLNFAFKTDWRKRWKNGPSNETDKNIILVRNIVPTVGSIRNGQGRVEQAGFLRMKEEDLLKLFPTSLSKKNWQNTLNLKRKYFVYSFITD